MLKNIFFLKRRLKDQLSLVLKNNQLGNNQLNNKSYTDDDNELSNNRFNNSYCSNHFGYNIIFISIIILIMGALMTATITYYDVNNINRKTKNTQDKFKIINTALISYLAKNGKLPCPAPLDCDLEGCNNDGIYDKKILGNEFRENGNIDNNCIADNSGVFESKNKNNEKLLYGNVPTISLGLDNNYLIDDWGNKLIYIVPDSITKTNSLKNILINTSKSRDPNITKEYVIDGDIFVLLSNNTNISGAYPYKNRNSNNFTDKIVETTINKDGTTTTKNKTFYNLPKKDFEIKIDDPHYLKYHKNINNLHNAFNNNDDDVDTIEIVQPDCTEIELKYKMIIPNIMCENFSYTGNYQTFTVPENVDTITVELWGASGGDINEISTGGEGGYIKGNLSVSPGEKYYIYVGQKGVTSEEGYNNSTAWNGGGKQSNTNPGGGGATDIRTTSGEWKNNLEKRILVAGGGGGASIPSTATSEAGGEDGADGCGCSSSLDGMNESEGRMCYGNNTINGQQGPFTYIAIGGGRGNNYSGRCTVLGGNTYSGGGGYYAGGGTCGYSNREGEGEKKAYSCKEATSALKHCSVTDFSFGGGAGGAGYYSSDFTSVSGECGGNIGNGRAKICYNVNTPYETFKFGNAKYGELSFSEQSCPYKVSNPPKNDDYYSLSNFRNNDGSIISNKMAIKCGKNGNWETEVVNNKEQIKYIYKCLMLDKCEVPSSVDPSTNWNVNYSVVNTGIVNSPDGNNKMKCIIDVNNEASWYQIQ